MIKLFLCHASEDKDDFVRPLAEALRADDITIWYDEYSLKAGDGLLQKISEGLNSCDYGIVVLSKFFFQKRWTTNELSGLFALETTERNVIIPIWKDVSREEVAAYSPIIADRVAIPSSHGIPAIVNQIRIATDTAERKSVFSQRNSIVQRYKKIDTTITASIASDRKLHASGTINEINKAGSQILIDFMQAINQLSNLGTTIKFQVTENADKSFHNPPLRKSIFVQAPFRLNLRFEYSQAIANATEHTKMMLLIWKVVPQEFWKNPKEYKDPKIRKIYEEEFLPKYNSELSLCWQSNDEMILSGKLADYALDILLGLIEKESISEG